MIKKDVKEDIYEEEIGELISERNLIYSNQVGEKNEWNKDI